MSGPRIGSLCSGYGGLDLAVMDAVPGAEVAWHAQYEPPDKKGRPDKHQWAARILEHRFPGVPNHGDITTIDYAAVEPVDILTAGFPCQDISLAGGRAGLLPGNRSGVWAHVARAIAALRPSLVFIENVRSLTSARAHSDLESCPRCVGDGKHRPALRALGAVLGDLAGLGLDAEWVCLPASGVGAPHQRERAFVLAWPAAEDPNVAAGSQRRLATPGQASGRGARPDACGRGGAPAADAPGSRCGWSEVAKADRGYALAGPRGVEPERGRRSLLGTAIGADARWGAYGPAVRRWEAALGKPAPAATDERGRLAPRFVEWMMGLSRGWVTGIPGIPRTAQLKALGNGVVPQQGAAAFRLLAERATAAVLPAVAPMAAPPEAVPLFQEIPVSSTVHIPLGAPPAWSRVVLDRAGGQCECTGQCGVAHKQSGGRCKTRHGGWVNRKNVVLLLAPKPDGLLLPLHEQTALPDAELMAWCWGCKEKAEKRAEALAKPNP